MAKLERLNNTAAEHAIVSIKHRRLPWTQCALWLLKENAKGAV